MKGMSLFTGEWLTQAFLHVAALQLKTSEPVIVNNVSIFHACVAWMHKLFLWLAAINLASSHISFHVGCLSLSISRISKAARNPQMRFRCASIYNPSHNLHHPL